MYMGEPLACEELFVLDLVHDLVFLRYIHAR